MPTTTVAQDYRHVTFSLKIEGQTTAMPDTSPTAASITSALTCLMEIRQAEKRTTMQGDSALLNDLVTVMDRYLDFTLRGQPQGTFSGTVAIRPLDFIFHRLTVRQGEGIAQVDLSMTQLYDLAETLADAVADLPQLKGLKPPKPKAEPGISLTGIAALMIAGIGVAAAVVVLGIRSNEGEVDSQFTSSTMEVRQTEAASAPPLENKAASSSEPEAAPAAPAASDPLNSATKPQATDLAAQDSAAVGNTSQGIDAGSQLQQVLATWTTPTDLTGSLTYTVTMAADGSILAAVPTNAAAVERQAYTPLAAAPTSLPETLPSGSSTFKVTLDLNNQALVEPQ